MPTELYSKSDNDAHDARWCNACKSWVAAECGEIPLSARHVVGAHCPPPVEVLI